MKKDSIKFAIPGRIEILGNHTDHQNGKVICSPICLTSKVYAQMKGDKLISITSMNYGKIVVGNNCRIINNSLPDSSTKMVIGIIRELNLLDIKEGISICINSDIPVGAGLGSSAAFSLSIIKAFNELYNMKLPVIQIAKLSQKIERKYLNKNSGLMDQLACLSSGIVAIDFEDEQMPKIQKIDFDFAKFGYGVYVIIAYETHENLIDDYKKITEEMQSVANCFHKKNLRKVSYQQFVENLNSISKILPDRSLLRAYHYFKENERVDKFIMLVKNNDIKEIIKTINESGISSSCFLQNYYSTASQNRSLDIATMKMKILFDNNELSTKVCGGGFGGSLLLIVEECKILLEDDLKRQHNIIKVL